MRQRTQEAIPKSTGGDARVVCNARVALGVSIGNGGRGFSQIWRGKGEAYPNLLFLGIFDWQDIC
jgi:hypothetical protein